MRLRPADTAVLALALAAPLAVVALAFFVAPDAANFRARLTHRVFYFHVPAAWVAYLAFAVTAWSSGRHLLSRDRRFDRAAAASAEIGLVFALVALATGLAWAAVEFGGDYRAWEDAKVVTLVVVILAYAAYLALRSGVEDPDRRSRVAGAFGVLAFLAVPLSYLASRVSLHPDFTRADQSLAPELGMLLGASVAAFTVLYAALLGLRTRLAMIEDALAGVA